MKSTFRSFFFIVALCFSSSSNAGFAGGPYLLWVNLSENKKIEEIINRNLREGEVCGEPDMKVFPTPEWISRDLISRAIVQGKKDSISTLDRLIRKKYPGYTDQGLDGVIIYNDSPSPHFSNFARGRKIVLNESLNKSSNEKAIWRAFCLLVPPITRPI